jgi:hypothetical protein
MSRRVATGRVPVPLGAADALELFTPEGERRWVDGWDPDYGGADPALVPGLVFRTAHGDEVTTWVVVLVDRGAHVVSYARVTPGSRAGTVTVRCVDDSPGRCVAEVTYDLTALSPAGEHALSRLDGDAFGEYLAEWERQIAVALG